MRTTTLEIDEVDRKSRTWGSGIAPQPRFCSSTLPVAELKLPVANVSTFSFPLQQQRIATTLTSHSLLKGSIS
jgi:hypothetical protein